MLRPAKGKESEGRLCREGAGRMTFYMEKGGNGGVGGKKGGYVPGRDALVDEVMRQWRDRYSTFSDLRVCVSTFNVNGKTPVGEIRGWLASHERADLYVLGLQEMDLSLGTYIVDSNSVVKEKAWLATIKLSLPRDRGKYQLVTSVRLVGMFLVVYARESNKFRITEHSSATVATGVQVLMNKLGNKGGVAVSLKVNDSRIAFVNTHLAAGDEAVERRNSDYREVSKLQFPNRMELCNHDVVIWLGDLNYRINGNLSGFSNEDIRRYSSSPTDYTKLLHLDQLKEQRDLGRVFASFSEGDIKFKPTYKYDIGTNTWDSSEKARSPAWCDRVLWIVHDDDSSCKQTHYESIQDCMLSDHKPVRAEFHVRIRHINQTIVNSLYEDAIREADKRANELLPQIALTSTELDFGEVYFNQSASLSIFIKNTGKTPVRFKLRERDDGRTSANWLRVFPLHHSLPVAQEIEIVLTVTVDKMCSWELEKGGNRLSDILVLSLENGRDHFIPVSATYNHRIFGVSLPRLFEHGRSSEAMLIQWDDSAASPSSDLPVPRCVHTLVSSLRAFGLSRIDLDEMKVDDHFFHAIREALEKDSPRALNNLPGITASSIYSALLRLVDALKDPLVPAEQRANWSLSCQDATRLWSLIREFPEENQQMIVFLTDFLREMTHANAALKDQIGVWADIVVRDTSSSSPALPRQVALRSIVDYSRDTALFHT